MMKSKNILPCYRRWMILLMVLAPLFLGTTYVIRENGKEVGRWTEHDGHEVIQTIDNTVTHASPRALARKKSARSSSTEAVNLHVLFLGNSLTNMNNLPGVIAELAKSHHQKMDYEMITPGGCTLAHHASDPAVLAKIKQGTWDFVVLQEQSQMPAMPEALLQTEVYPYAKKLSDLVKMSNAKARVVFYMAMAHKNGESIIQNEKTTTMNFEQTQEKINAAYRVMAEHNHALLAPVGDAWKRVRTTNPALELYVDDRHPNPSGTYLAACVLYGTLFEQSPVGLPFLDQKKSTAEILQAAAENALQ